MNDLRLTGAASLVATARMILRPLLRDRQSPSDRMKYRPCTSAQLAAACCAVHDSIITLSTAAWARQSASVSSARCVCEPNAAHRRLLGNTFVVSVEDIDVVVEEVPVVVAELVDVIVPVEVADDVESWDEVGVEVADVVADEV